VISTSTRTCEYDASRCASATKSRMSTSNVRFMSPPRTPANTAKVGSTELRASESRHNTVYCLSTESVTQVG
jgi:hypothetical protein